MSTASASIKPTVRPVTDRILKSEGEANDASFVIFGASGDLTARKLLPALYDLWQDGYLSDRSPVVGVARREKTDAEFRAEMRAAVNEEARTAPVAADDWDRFAAPDYFTAGSTSPSRINTPRGGRPSARSKTPRA